MRIYMKDKDIDIYSYDKIVFVDASGDDGFSFGETSGDGSSFTFVVSCLVVNPEDFNYNCDILNKMKDALHISHEKELKSTTLKRHRFSQDAYAELAKIKGDVFSFIAFKKALQKSKDPSEQELCDTSTKELSGLIHSFPIFALTRTGILPENARVLTVIDHLKKSEVESIAKSFKKFDIPDLIDCETIYRDSKSEKFPLIQLADAICGTIRNYFEKTLNSIPIQKYCQICNRQKAMCARGPALKAWKSINFNNSERIVLSLHKNRLAGNDIMIVSITTLPFSFYFRYRYIDCYFGDECKKRS